MHYVSVILLYERLTPQKARDIAGVISSRGKRGWIDSIFAGFVVYQPNSRKARLHMEGKKVFQNQVKFL